MAFIVDLPKEKSSIIKVIGVGGGGGNAVNFMYTEGINGVDFIICNTDQQVLESSPIPNKLRIGDNLTEGRGAGSNPEVGKLLIWPAGFTHMHRGNPPLEGEKMYITGWFTVARVDFSEMSG